jgi:hypothetical protein
LYAGHHPEQLAAEMGQVSGPARNLVDLARIRLGMGDELGDGLGAGNDGLTSKTKESLLMLATGTMSRVTVTVLFSYSVTLTK